jgi:tRNA (mo5U34)-methyltransferase
MTEDARLRDEMAGLNFYHTIPLTPTLSTAGWSAVAPIVEMTRRVMQGVDVSGKRVLDIGCRDGLLSFEAEKRGAVEVIGIDNDLSPGVPEFLIRTLKSRARIELFNLFDLRPESFGQFDVVIFAGVLYHLRYPFWALKLIRDVLSPGGVMIVETGVLADANRHALLFCPAREDSPYEPTSVTFFNQKGLRDTLGSMGFEVLSSECLMNLTAPSDGLPDKPPIDRCVMVCRKLTGPADSIEHYWTGASLAHDRPLWEGKIRANR